MKYQILWSTPYSGQYDQSGHIASLRKVKTIVRAEYRPVLDELGLHRLVWRQEGDEIAAYLDREDAENEAKAVARLRPVSSDA